MAGAVYVATESFVANVDGVPQTILAGKTHVREGHELLVNCPGYFKPVGDRVHFDVESASAAPGERRGDPSQTTAAYDPTDHTVKEVLEYLEKADSAEKQRVKATEARSERSSKMVAEA
jgi:hypothetical protein